MIEDPDPDLDFGNLVTERRRERWELAAARSDLPVDEWIFQALDAAAAVKEVLPTVGKIVSAQSASDAFSTSW